MCFRIITMERCRSDAALRVRRRPLFPKRWLSRRIRPWLSIDPLRDKSKPATDLADRDRGGSVRRKPLGRNLSGYVQISRPAWPLAKAGVQVVMHTRLSASDYGLLDENTLAPRPNYWGALLWRQLMGKRRARSGVPIHTGLHVYAHCSSGLSSFAKRHSLMFMSDAYRCGIAAIQAKLWQRNVRAGAARLNGKRLTLALRLACA